MLGPGIVPLFFPRWPLVVGPWASLCRWVRRRVQRQGNRRERAGRWLGAENSSRLLTQFSIACSMLCGPPMAGCRAGGRTKFRDGMLSLAVNYVVQKPQEGRASPCRRQITLPRRWLASTSTWIPAPANSRSEPSLSLLSGFSLGNAIYRKGNGAARRAKVNGWALAGFFLAC